MKFAALYNVFDGEELLEASLKSIRNKVDFVVAVWQNISYTGESHPNTDLRNLLYQYKKDGLIDALQYYIPKSFVIPGTSEIEKRNIALDIAIDNNCTHVIPMDVDELYTPEALSGIRTLMEDARLDAAFGYMNTYYKYGNVRLTSKEQYCVPLFYRIGLASKFAADTIGLPVVIDPARRLWVDIARRDVIDDPLILMEHYSYVRRDIWLKLRNSSSAKHFAGDIRTLVDQHRDFNPLTKKKILMPFGRYFHVEILPEQNPLLPKEFLFTPS